jgi:branched-chain amino acid transport system permease protein
MNLIWIILALLPFLLIKNAFIITILSLVGIYALASLGLNLIMGYSGQISIGHAAFMGIGAYVSTLLTINYNIPIVFGIILGGITAFLFGILIGFPALRLSGFYLAIATMGFVVAVEQFFSYFENVTGGHAGIRNIPFPYIWNSDVEKYLLVLGFLYIMYVITTRLINSKTGRAWMGIRENEIASSVMGVNVAWYKVLAFAIGSMFAGIAGALYAHVIGYIAPSDFGIAKSLDLLAISVIGGMASIEGPFLGALIYVAMPFLFSRTNFPLSIIFGIILIFVVLFMPLGISFYVNKFRLKYLNGILSYFKRSRRPYGTYVKTNTGNIHYAKRGNGSIRVVLVHGNFASARFFEPLMEKIPPAEFTVYALDLPNFGFSDELVGDVSIDKYATALQDFVDALSIDNFILLGHSLGGAVAMGYAVRNPNKLRKLVLVDPAPVYGMPSYDESAYKIIDVYRKNPDMIKRALMMNAPTYDNEKFFDRIAADALRIAKKAFIGNAKALSSYNYTSQVANLEIPVVVVYGDKDVILDYESMKKTADSFKNAKLVVLKGIGHSPVVEAQDKIIEILQEKDERF